MASRTGSLPRNEKETLETPPLVSTPGSSALMRRTASMKATRVAGVLLDAGADGEDVGVEDDVLGVEAGLLREQADRRGGRWRTRRSTVSACPASSKAMTTTAAP